MLLDLILKTFARILHPLNFDLKLLFCVLVEVDVVFSRMPFVDLKKHLVILLVQRLTEEHCQWVK